jgi:hypothetical protein
MSLVIANYNNGNYDDRVIRGKKAEAEIVAELIAEGHHVAVPSETADMYDKIDAYVKLTPELVKAYPVFSQFTQYVGRLLPIDPDQAANRQLSRFRLRTIHRPLGKDKLSGPRT